MRAAGLIALFMTAGAAGAPAPVAQDWLVMLRWQAMPAAAATPTERTWRSATTEAVPDWPVLRLRPGASAHWRHEAWLVGEDNAAAWTPRGPVLLTAARRHPQVHALTLQAQPTRQTGSLALSWSARWPTADQEGSTEAQGVLTLAPGRWVTLAEWAPPVRAGAAATGDQQWSTDAAPAAGWRLQVRAERP